MFRPSVLTAALLCVFAPAVGQVPSSPVASMPTDAPFDVAVGAQVVTALAAELEKNFVYPDTGRAYAAMLRRNLASGAYASFPTRTAFAERVTADLQAVSPDRHLRLRVPGAGPRPRPATPAATAGAAGPSRPPLMEQAGWIAPGIAYVRFNAFLGDPQVLKDFTAFLDSHTDAKALIIDARTHHGGGLDEMDVLFPRIFTQPQTVMVMDTRASVARERGDLDFASLVRAPSPPELSRAEHRVTPLSPASPLGTARIYYLTSGRTASAGEHLATVLKYTHRATLIGDTTAGAGNFGDNANLPGGYAAFVPVGHSYYPGTKGWEGTGVEPDVKVAPEQALTEALVREGVPAVQAAALSASHQPAEPMTRR